VQIYFSSYTNDRWGCIQSVDYVGANDGTAYLDAKGLDRLVALATTALAADLTFAIDSPGTNPCTSANMFYLIKDQLLNKLFKQDTPQAARLFAAA